MPETALFQSNLPSPNWLGRMPKAHRKILEYSLIALGVVFFCLELWLTRQSVLDTAEAGVSPIELATVWTPENQVYHPGDTIRLRYIVNTRFDVKKGPLLTLSLDAFENTSTTELYGGSLIGRIVDSPGSRERVAVRRIPPECSEGTYRLQGWMRAETPRRTVPVPFRSAPFTVTRNGTQ